MKISIITVTKGGSLLGQRIANLLKKYPENRVNLYVPSRFSRLCPESLTYEKPLAPLIKNLFNNEQALIMIMALGIVIRMIAPHLKSKRTDPAVLVLDEKGEHVISALSGHWGGANELTNFLAAELGAHPVITTSTDVQNLPAADLLAKQYNLIPENFSELKAVNAALVNGEHVTIYTPFPLNITPTPGITVCPWALYKNKLLDNEGWQVLITNKVIPNTKNTLFLRPKNLIIGIGCRKGTAKEQIMAVLEQALEQVNKSILSIKLIATIDLRAEEPGLTGLAADLGVPLITFSRKEINDAYSKYPGIFKNSKFVKEKIGVGGVCEPVTLLACPQAKLIKPKFPQNGVTAAIAEESWPWSDWVPEVLNT
ncbi:cobalt-precorrin 5A hydrolase [Desulfolucanica intricata]|uniref:cobalt-precorrin 5A hydrolase n=1 Tax=Desulfolucanica intricata TaxID=1285191 RepID=UPI000831B70D|nr:cobalt-precorrin 5A hydrolase [Desulfolucanica intricata]